jgi:hypothetical protein
MSSFFWHWARGAASRIDGNRAAIADTHPEGGDGTKIAAPFMSSGGAKQSPNPSIQSTTP